tara:strand:- start:344 stop:727 length:384 start_codon:yes stop_codon:yes gene_type:complete
MDKIANIYHNCVSETMTSFDVTGSYSYDNSGNVSFKNDLSSNPTQEQFTAKYNEIYALKPFQELREKRNQLLAETDWTQNRDVILADDEAWKTYRQALRDLPSVSVDAAYDVAGNLINVVYPTKPGQ